MKKCQYALVRETMLSKTEIAEPQLGFSGTGSAKIVENRFVPIFPSCQRENLLHLPLKLGPPLDWFDWIYFEEMKLLHFQDDVIKISLLLDLLLLGFLLDLLQFFFWSSHQMVKSPNFDQQLHLCSQPEACHVSELCLPSIPVYWSDWSSSEWSLIRLQGAARQTTWHKATLRGDYIDYIE